MLCVGFIGVICSPPPLPGIAGCVSRTSTAPLDRVKVIWQARGGKAASTGLIGSFKTMLREGGYASMWRGNGVNCIKIAPESAIKFQAYEFFKKLIRGDRQDQTVALQEKFLAGAMAGATAQTLIYPMEVRALLFAIFFIDFVMMQLVKRDTATTEES
ncbi:unnamed protein product [Dibothriocephalus latus]|uniref:ADP/ATP translocase n=1 Tax=Dibothriocephalus latus TaxID=60516 RepID=A0A3P7NHC8_DIBLA|nr:unnamed protein product [Dibothriocephalus latus]